MAKNIYKTIGAYPEDYEMFCALASFLRVNKATLFKMVMKMLASEDLSEIDNPLKNFDKKEFKEFLKSYRVIKPLGAC